MKRNNAGFIFLKALVVFLINSNTSTVESRRLNGAYKIGQEENGQTSMFSPEAKQESNVVLPLQPPFRIIEIGQPRTGSTFQFQLLYALAALKSPPNTNIDVEFLFRPHTTVEDLEEKLSRNSFVYKAHSLNADTIEYLSETLEEGSVFLFTSMNPESTQQEIMRVPLLKSPLALYTQEADSLRKCSLCEVEQYQEIFNLTDAEVNSVKDYISKFEIFRKCCGLQMSQYEMARLNGCDMSEYQGTLEYPNCEIYNKTLVEYELHHHPSGIRYKDFSEDFSGVAEEKYVCDKIDKKVASGTWFNGQPFLGCKEYGFKEKVNDRI